MRQIPLAVLLMLMALGVARAQETALPLDRITLPPGFTISLYASGVADARSLALGDSGTVFVGSRGVGNVYALADADGDNIAETVRVIARGLDTPNGVAFHDGALYVAEVGRILRYGDIEARLDSPPEAVVVTDDLPDERAHGWKYLRFGPDGKLYVPAGAPCNICEVGAPYGAILRMRADGSAMEVFASGIRNTVGFDWHPATGELWFTDNGRDWVSDDLPPDELNRAPEAGLHFGFPYCHAGEYPDTDFAAGHTCAEFTPPAAQLGPHVAPLGVRFYTGDSFPAEYRNQIFIAEHGSWNRSTPIGYRLTLVRLEDDSVVSYEPFAEGWLNADGSIWGRPVDVMVMPDGALLVSDDYAGAVYRIAYTGS